MLRRVMPVIGASVCALLLASGHDTDLHASHPCHLQSSDMLARAAAGPL
jgi:hypothetical protein